ncbi:MAG: thrombospondin type 3 repeat-containing protein [Gammaproteobacteria bacterium]|nr:thrombospondin type 3 repeat-containing protein [Gammaproteobacteria bacterium]
MDTGALTTVAGINQRMHGMTFDDTGTILYGITNGWNGSWCGGTIVSIDTVTGVLTSHTPGSYCRTNGIAYHQGFLYTIDQQNRIYKIDPTTWSSSYVMNGPSRRGMASDGTTLYITNCCSLYTVNLGSNTLTNLGSFNGAAYNTIKDMAYNPKTGRLNAIDRSGRVFDLDPATRTLTLIADLNNNIQSIAIMAFEDVDGDGMNDYWEQRFGLNVGIDDSQADLDNDGLVNIDEYNARTNPTKPDTDGDGLTDKQEVSVYGTSPLLVDTDGDTISDGDEVAAGTDPLVDNDLFATVPGLFFDQFPDTVVDGNGNVHMVWFDDYTTIMYTMLDANGNILIDATDISGPSGGGQPSIAVTSDNHIYVVYNDDNNWGTVEVGFIHLNPGAVPHNGAAANPALLVADGPALVSTDDFEQSSHPRLVVDRNDKAHVVWQDDLAGAISQETVRYAKVDRNGSILVADREVIPCQDQYRCAEPDIALDKGGNVHIVAATDPSNHYNRSEIYYVMIDADTGNTLIDKTKLTDALSRGMRARYATISKAANDQLNIVWMEALVNNNGSTATLSMMRIDPSLAAQDGTASDVATLKVMEAVFQTAKNSRHPHARTDANGNIHITYQDGTNTPGNITDANYMVVDANGDVVLDRPIATPNADWWTIVKVSDGAKHIAVATAADGIKIYKTRPTPGVSGSGGSSLIEQAMAAGSNIFGNGGGEASSGSLDTTSIMLMASGLFVLRRRKRFH